MYRSVTATYEFAGGELVPFEVLPEYHRAYAYALVNFSHLGVGEGYRTSPDHYYILLGESQAGPLTAGIWPLRVWKTMRGFAVYRVYVGGWSKERVKDYIRARFNEAHGGACEVYFLLVGDQAMIPVPAGWTHPQGGYTQSDHWYADVRGDDGIADVPLGRVPATTTQDVEITAAKLIRYERDQSPDWQARKVLIVNDRVHPAHGNWLEEILGSLGVPYDRQNGALDGVTNQTLKAHIQGSGGYGVLTYFGHGDANPYRWDHWNYLLEHFTTGDVSSLTTANWLPLVYNVACYSAEWAGGHCEAWRGNPGGGGIAGWGFSRRGYTDAAAVMSASLRELPYTLPETRTWLATNLAKLEMLREYPDQFGRANNHTFHLVVTPRSTSGPLTAASSPSMQSRGPCTPTLGPMFGAGSSAQMARPWRMLGSAYTRPARPDYRRCSARKKQIVQDR